MWKRCQHNSGVLIDEVILVLEQLAKGGFLAARDGQRGSLLSGHPLPGHLEHGCPEIFGRTPTLERGLACVRLRRYATT